MPQKSSLTLKNVSPYNAAITREQFLFYETRTTAQLVCSGLDKNAVVEKIVKENLLQYPTEKYLRRMALACLRRLDALDNHALVQAIATQSSNVSKQICLYAMMKQYRIVWDFMIAVIGTKYRNRDMSFGRRDLNAFFLDLQEQDAWVSSWSDSTVAKMKQVLAKILMENAYIDSRAAGRLNPVTIYPLLENAIRDQGNTMALPAFNCFA